MHEYAVLLGHQPHITIAELAAVVPGFSLTSIERNLVALFSCDEKIGPETFANLGGSQLLAERITEADVSMDDLPQLLSNEAKTVKKKVVFSLRCFGVPKPAIKTAYRRGKEAIKNLGKPCRYVGNEKKSAATAQLLDLEVANPKKGVELFVINREKGLWVGRTIGVQDINAYTWRDMEKPVRDTTVGLLPPKLAQIMINFGAFLMPVDAKSKKKKKPIFTVFDPFCGTGVIPLECMLRRWHVVASDSALKAVNGCKKNIEWLRKERKILKKEISADVSKHDATKAFAFKELPDMVVTETSLGPSLKKTPTKTDAKKLLKDSEKLQEAFLKNAAETLPGVPIVLTLPFWKLAKEEVHHEKFWKVVEDAGYKAVVPEGADVENSERPSFLYQRKDQFVGREIVLLVPTATHDLPS